MRFTVPCGGRRRRTLPQRLRRETAQHGRERRFGHFLKPGERCGVNGQGLPCRRKGRYGAKTRGEQLHKTGEVFPRRQQGDPVERTGGKGQAREEVLRRYGGAFACGKGRKRRDIPEIAAAHEKKLASQTR